MASNDGEHKTLILPEETRDAHVPDHAETDLIYEKRTQGDDVRLERGLASPVRLLPPELLGEIFLRTLGPSGLSSPPVVAQVCNSWRRIALENPSMWTSLDVNFDLWSKGAPNLLFRRAFDHTGNLPLNIGLRNIPHDLDVASGLAKDCLHSVCLHIHRTRSLTVIADHSNPVGDPLNLSAIFPGDPPAADASALESLHLEHHFFPGGFRDTLPPYIHAPHLRQISLILPRVPGERLPQFSPRSFCDLSELRLQLYSIDQHFLHALLNGCKKTMIKFTFVVGHIDGDGHTSSDTLWQITLPSLKIFDWSYRPKRSEPHEIIFDTPQLHSLCLLSSVRRAGHNYPFTDNSFRNLHMCTFTDVANSHSAIASCNLLEKANNLRHLRILDSYCDLDDISTLLHSLVAGKPGHSEIVCPILEELKLDITHHPAEKGQCRFWNLITEVLELRSATRQGTDADPGAQQDGKPLRNLDIIFGCYDGERPVNSTLELQYAALDVVFTDRDK